MELRATSFCIFVLTTLTNQFVDCGDIDITAYALSVDQKTDLELQLNNKRRLLDGTDIVYVKWNDDLANDSYRDATMLLKHFGCQRQWQCDDKNCLPYVSLLLSQPALYRVVMDNGDINEGLEKMFAFLDTEASCGNRYNQYDTHVNQCFSNAYKVYHLTYLFGCSITLCSDKTDVLSTINKYHFTCTFNSYTPIRTDPSGKSQLYTSASSLADVCSNCSPIARRCNNKLCHSDAVGLKTCSMVGMIFICNFGNIVTEEYIGLEKAHELELLLNEKRRFLDGTNVAYIHWNNLLSNDSRRDSNLLINFFQCGKNWNCSARKCPTYVDLILSQPALYYEMLSENGVTGGLNKMFSFLNSPDNCGLRFNEYDVSKEMCRMHAYKTYHLTSLFGCSMSYCLNIKSSPPVTFYFVCTFDASEPLRADSQGKAVLYNYASTLSEVCSECPMMAARCNNKLCHSTGLMVTTPMIAAYVMLFLITN